MPAPIDNWEWDAETEQVMALDVSDTRGGEAVPVDFSDEPVGRLAAAAPNMARALLADMRPWGDGLMHDERACPVFAGGTCSDTCFAKRDALRKAGAL